MAVPPIGAPEQLADASKQQLLQVARLIAASMLLGLILFWIIGFTMGRSSAAPTAQPGISEKLFLEVWAALAIAAFAGAVYFRGRAIAFADRALGVFTTSADIARVQTNLVVAWALLEGPALLSGVALYMFGYDRVVLAALPVYLVGFALTFPRAGWFGLKSA